MKNIKILDQSKLPEKMHITNVYDTLNELIKKKRNFNKIPDIKNACRLLINDEINSNAFKLKGFNHA